IVEQHRARELLHQLVSTLPLTVVRRIERPPVDRKLLRRIGLPQEVSEPGRAARRLRVDQWPLFARLNRKLRDPERDIATVRAHLTGPFLILRFRRTAVISA